MNIEQNNKLLQMGSTPWGKKKEKTRRGEKIK